MKNYYLFTLAIVLLSCTIWTSASFASLGDMPVPDVTALTIDEAHEKYGVNSGYKYPLHFTVNSKVGPQKCVSIGPDCSIACPTAKIYYQSPRHYLNHDGSRIIRVDLYYDINEPITSRTPTC